MIKLFNISAMLYSQLPENVQKQGKKLGLKVFIIYIFVLSFNSFIIKSYIYALDIFQMIGDGARRGHSFKLCKISFGCGKV